MSGPTPSLDKNAGAPQGEPRQALSGGGSNVQAGSDQGGSRSGAEPTGKSVQDGGFKPSPDAGGAGGGTVPAEEASFASPDGEESPAHQAIANTGDPQAVAKEDGDVERGSGGDDVDAASG